MIDSTPEWAACDDADLKRLYTRCHKLCTAASVIQYNCMLRSTGDLSEWFSLRILPHRTDIRDQPLTYPEFRSATSEVRSIRKPCLRVLGLPVDFVSYIDTSAGNYIIITVKTKTDFTMLWNMNIYTHVDGLALFHPSSQNRLKKFDSADSSAASGSYSSSPQDFRLWLNLFFIIIFRSRSLLQLLPLL
jgi:hypothetical protein